MPNAVHRRASLHRGQWSSLPLPLPLSLSAFVVLPSLRSAFSPSFSIYSLGPWTFLFGFAF